MKKLVMLAALAALIACGCTSVKVKTPEWEASAWSTFLKEDVKQIAVNRTADGYSVLIDGVRRDVSERLPESMDAMGNLVGSAVGAAVTQVIGARADAKVKVLEAKAKYCEDGSCGRTDCSTCTAK